MVKERLETLALDINIAKFQVGVINLKNAAGESSFEGYNINYTFCDNTIAQNFKHARIVTEKKQENTKKQPYYMIQ